MVWVVRRWVWGRWRRNRVPLRVGRRGLAVAVERSEVSALAKRKRKACRRGSDNGLLTRPAKRSGCCADCCVVSCGSGAIGVSSASSKSPKSSSCCPSAKSSKSSPKSSSSSASSSFVPCSPVSSCDSAGCACSSPFPSHIFLNHACRSSSLTGRSLASLCSLLHR